MPVRRCAAIVLAVAAVLAPAAQPSPTPPSAPSEYVEVVPTAGGGTPAGPRPRSSSAAGSSDSAVGAAADAVGSGDAWVIGHGAVLVAATLSVGAAAALRRRPPHEPKGW
jgi:hypothetical protein